jgi:hypothetical protein
MLEKASLFLANRRAYRSAMFNTKEHIMNVFSVFKGLMFLEGVVSPQLLRDHPDFADGYGNAVANARARGPLSQPADRRDDARELPACACG